MEVLKRAEFGGFCGYRIVYSASYEVAMIASTPYQSADRFDLAN